MPNPDGCYPDASSVQLYACERYVELETLSAARHLAVNESMHNVVTWDLLERVSGETPESLVARLGSFPTHP